MAALGLSYSSRNNFTTQERPPSGEVSAPRVLKFIFHRSLLGWRTIPALL
jgi:hypothetical protein